MSQEKMPHGHSAEKEECFEAQERIMEKIYEIGFAAYVESLPDLDRAFDLEKHKPKGHEDLHRCVCCMDEGTPWGVHSAGSGILLADDEFDRYFELAKPDSISSHAGCGAAKIRAKQLGVSPEEADEMAKQWAMQKAREKGVKHVHFSAREMNRPEGFHDARVCYYDGTGQFNYEGVEGLPKGFVVGRKYMTKKASLGEDGVAGAIMFGDHGFGDLLTEDKPFIIAAIAETEEGLEALKEELAELSSDYGKKIRIDGFVAK